MTVEISYWAGRATNGLQMAAEPGRDGTAAEAESVASLSATPKLSGATPDGQTAITFTATEAVRFEYSDKGAITAVANSNYVAAGERVWITPRTGWCFSIRTA